MTNTPNWVKTMLIERKHRSLFRKTVVMASAQTPLVNINNSPYTAFCSNDYLGLSNHPNLIKALHQASLEYGVGSGASHLVNGHNVIHQALEEELADWLGYERVMLFSTGYMANLGVLSALANKNGVIVQDKLNHASLLDGAKLSDAKLKRYLHKDITSAERILSKIPISSAYSSLLVTDGVFSMDGDIAPLKRLSLLAQQYESILMMDDAHGLGCCGEKGKGVMELEGVTSKELPILIGTFGKAFGTSGAFVAASSEMIDYLIQFARPYIYTTAISPAIASATRASLMLIKSSEGECLREKLTSNITFFRDLMSQQGVELSPSNTAIQPILIGDSDKALFISEALKKEGFWCTAIRPPTVQKGTARLRITLSAQHSYDQIQHLVQALTVILERKE